MSQILAGGGAVTLTLTWSVDGTPTDVGDVTIGIVDGNGDTVVAAGTATTNATNGVYTYNLADQNSPDQLTITWTDVNTTDTRIHRLEVVGNWLFTENQARTFSAKADATSALIPLASATEYPDATIADERERILADIEYWTGRGWVPRYARVELAGTGTSTLDLHRGVCRTSDGYTLHRPGRFADIGVILTASIGSTSVSVGNIQINPTDETLIRTDGGVWTAGTYTDPLNVTVEYVYGLPYLVDGVDRIALKLLVDRLVPSMWPDRVISADGEYGTTRFIQPGGPMHNVSRLPEVNQWVDVHNHKVLVG